MTVPVHIGVIHGRDHIAAAIKNIQGAAGVPVNIGSIDGQQLSAKIIEMQKRMVVLGKMTNNQVNLSIDEQHMSAKLAQIEALL